MYGSQSLLNSRSRLPRYQSPQKIVFEALVDQQSRLLVWLLAAQPPRKLLVTEVLPSR